MLEAQACGAQVVDRGHAHGIVARDDSLRRDADEVAIFLDPYIRAMREWSTALVFSHHTPKERLHDYRGSGGDRREVDVLLLLRRPGTGKRPEDVGNETEEDPGDRRRSKNPRAEDAGSLISFIVSASIDQRYSVGEAPLPLRDHIIAVLKQGGATTRH